VAFVPVVAKLIPHPDVPDEAVASIVAHVTRRAGGELAVSFSVEGDLGRLRIPEARAPLFANRLWQHTCFECFVRAHGADAYHEFNFSPSGEWAHYAFERYRARAPATAAQFDLAITARSNEGTRLDLETCIPLESFLPQEASGPLDLGLSAVVEDSDGALSYWALAHPAGKPDFHHADAHTLKLR
jgi:hypothetical protein